MPHDTPLISTIVAGLVLAFIFGAIANRFRMPPLVGYLVAGVLVGPYTPGFVANGELATELSEIGVILLMFGVGLHFSLKDLLSVRAIAVPGALVQIAGATAMGLLLALWMGWSLGAGLIFGLALSVASTVVLLKALQDRHIVESERGRIAVGWLIVEDIAMVLALVLIPAFAGLAGATTAELHDPFIVIVERFTGWHLDLWGILAITVIKLAAFIGFMLVVGRRVIPAILHFTAHTGSRELFRLAVLAIALGVAAGASYLFGVSLALGAFFAGMILSESELSNRAAQESLPFRDAFSVLFFVSVGMLFDPMILIQSPLPVLGTVFVIIIGKSLLSFIIAALFRQPIGTSLTISASLAQIGEFSFILAALGVGLGVLPPEGRDLILAGALISIVLNPVVFYLAERLKPRMEARIASRTPEPKMDGRVEPDLVAAATPVTPEPINAEDIDERIPVPLTGHSVLIGFGRVGSVIAEGLKQRGKPFVVVEDSEARVAAAHAAGMEVIVGNAATHNSLVLANVAQAQSVIIAIPNAFEAGQATLQCRKLNAAAVIIARAHADEEVTYLRDLGANHVIMGEREIGLGMLGWVTGDNEIAASAASSAAGLAAVEAALRVEPVFDFDVPTPSAPAAGRVVAPAAITEPESPPAVPDAIAPPSLDDLVRAAKADAVQLAPPPVAPAARFEPYPVVLPKPVVADPAPMAADPAAAEPSPSRIVDLPINLEAIVAAAVTPVAEVPAAEVETPPVPVAETPNLDASADAAVNGVPEPDDFTPPPPPPRPRIKAPTSAPGKAFDPDAFNPEVPPPVKEDI